MRSVTGWLTGTLFLGLLGCGDLAPQIVTPDDDDDDGIYRVEPDGWRLTLDLFQLQLPGGQLSLKAQNLPRVYRSGTLQRGSLVSQHMEARPDTELSDLGADCWLFDQRQRPNNAVTAQPRCPCAGDVLIKVDEQKTMVLSPAKQGLYTPCHREARPWKIWQAGDRVLVLAEGRDFGPFASSLLLPAPLQVRAVVHRYSYVDGVAAIPRGQDLELFWQPRGGWIAVGVEQDLIDDDQIVPTLTGLCRFAASDGRGVLPATLLKHFSAEAARTYLVTYRMDQRELTPGYNEVLLRVFNGEARQIVLH